jgi:release factor glutamine methyltransferase
MMHWFYKNRIAEKNLAVDGQLFFEINQYLGPEMVDLLKIMNFKI